MTNREHRPSKAAALKYDGKNAPVLVAKGSGTIANEIIEQAKEHEIHIHNDPLLLEVLSRLELGDEIPEALYIAVAKIIAFAYFLQGKHPGNQGGESTASNSSLSTLSSSDKLASRSTKKVE